MSRVAVVTGTSAGVGAEVATHLLARGWEVIGIARRSVVFGDRYRHLTLDLANAAALDRAIANDLSSVFAAAWNRIGLVNNAASPLIGALPGSRAIDVRDAVSTNLVAPLALMAAVGRYVSPATPVRVVNVSTGAAVGPFPGLSVYGSSKAGLRMASQIVAAEWTSTVPHAPRRRDAAVMSYEPGIVDTAMQAHARSQDPRVMPWVGMFQQFERDRRLVPADQPAADIVAFLESDNQPPFAERRFGAA